MTLKGLKNGLGYEEINQPGSIVSSLHLTGSILSDLNIVATGSLVGTDIVGTTVSGTVTFGKNIVATGSVVSTAGVMGGISMGSPSAMNMKIQTGSISLSAGSVGWATFGDVFTGNPHVVVSYSDLTLGSPAGTNVVVGSLANLGSVYFTGAVASKAVDWIAIGAA